MNHLLHSFISITVGCREMIIMSDDPLLRAQSETVLDEVSFDFIKANDFRVIWVDGAIGSITAHGHVHLACYSERPAIPRRQVFKVDPETGALGDLIPEKTIGRNAYVREMSCDAMMTPDVARSLGQWLITLADSLDKGETE
jgi:hypothetical protein